MKAADARTRQLRNEAKARKDKEREETIEKICLTTPYAYEACRFDRIMNPKKWAAP